MLKIRLQRVGRRNSPAFRVVVTESTRGPKSGDNVELVGTYNPHTHQASLNTERIKHWIGNGAQVSPRVHNLLITEKVIEGKKINVLPRKSPIVKEEKTEETSQESSTPAPSDESKAGEVSTPEEVKAEEKPVEEEEKKPPAPENVPPPEKEVVEKTEEVKEKPAEEEAKDTEKKEG